MSKVTDMGYMFRDAWSFNQPLNDWNVSNVTNMGAMFSRARSFNHVCPVPLTVRGIIITSDAISSTTVGGGRNVVKGDARVLTEEAPDVDRARAAPGTQHTYRYTYSPPNPSAADTCAYW